MGAVRCCRCVTVASRMQLLRTRFLHGLQGRTNDRSSSALAGRIFVENIKEKGNQVGWLIKACPVYAESSQLAEKYAKGFRAAIGKGPAPKESDAMRERATGVALRKSA
jgi:hypothetical protein